MIDTTNVTHKNEMPERIDNLYDEFETACRAADRKRDYMRNLGVDAELYNLTYSVLRDGDGFVIKRDGEAFDVNDVLYRADA